MNKGIISDIEMASSHDGFGTRTVVFFKGCPLSCRWCHNPECINKTPETLFYPEKCIHCGKCEDRCFAGARVTCGKKMSANEILTEILRDKPDYGKLGGVTFSVGEPLYQKDFLNTLVDLCLKNDIGCAAETSLIYFDEEIFKKLNFVMADFKIWDSALHKGFTGSGNEIIKENFIKLNKLCIPIIARTPVIPEINQEIGKISAFLNRLENVIQYELLPYHPLGNEKRRALLRETDGFSVPKKELMKELNKYAYVR